MRISVFSKTAKNRVRYSSSKDSKKSDREKNNICQLFFFLKMQSVMLKPCYYRCCSYFLLFVWALLSFDGEIFMEWQIMNTWNCFQLKWINNDCSLWFSTNMSAIIVRLAHAHVRPLNVNSRQNGWHRFDPKG